MATYTLTFKQLQDSHPMNTWGALTAIDNWYDSLSQALQSWRPETYAEWVRRGKFKRDIHKELYELKKELIFFLTNLGNDEYYNIQISITSEQLAILRTL